MSERLLVLYLRTSVYSTLVYMYNSCCLISLLVTLEKFNRDMFFNPHAPSHSSSLIMCSPCHS